MSVVSSSKSKIIYIGGATNSGSSLLDLLLGNHPEIAGCGELNRLMLNRVCSCGERMGDCPHWSQIIQGYEDAVGVHGPEVWERFPLNYVRHAKPRRYLPNMGEMALIAGNRQLARSLSPVSVELSRYLESARNSWILSDVIAQRTGAKYIVDSTKTAVRLKSLYLTRPDALYLIHLVRDGRAVAASLRRRRSIPISQGAARWKSMNKNVDLMAKSIPNTHKLRVYYEDLCDNPEREFGRICEFVGVDYVDVLTQINFRVLHSIPGNPMLFNPGQKILKDERWREELTPVDLLEFEKVAGDLFEAYGYKKSNQYMEK